MPPMDEPQRIAIETESGWLRIRDNVERGMTASMEMRLASLPGGKDGEASRRVRKEVEARMDKVGCSVCGSRARADAQIRASMWDIASHNLRVNGHDYDKFVQGEAARLPWAKLTSSDRAVRRGLGSQSVGPQRRTSRVGDHRLGSTETAPVTVAGARTRYRAAARTRRMATGGRRRGWWVTSLCQYDHGLTASDTTAKKAAEIPRPPRHAETLKTFEQVAENMAELTKVGAST